VTQGVGVGGEADKKLTKDITGEGRWGGGIASKNF